MDTKVELNSFFLTCDVKKKKKLGIKWSVLLTKLLNLSGHQFSQVKNKGIVLGNFKVSLKFNGNTKAASCRVPCSFHYEDQLPL